MNKLEHEKELLNITRFQMDQSWLVNTMINTPKKTEVIIKQPRQSGITIAILRAAKILADAEKSSLIIYPTTTQTKYGKALNPNKEMITIMCEDECFRGIHVDYVFTDNIRTDSSLILNYSKTDRLIRVFTG